MMTTNKQRDPSYGHRLANAKSMGGYENGNISEHDNPDKNKNTTMESANKINNDRRNTNQTNT